LIERKPQPGSIAATENARHVVDAVYRADSRRIFATLIRLLGDFDVAEEALHEAFKAALEQRPRDGVPDNPGICLGVGCFAALSSRSALEPPHCRLS
jgi:RNA polymerase sigma-70 factor (ECF subfamily)